MIAPPQVAFLVLLLGLLLAGCGGATATPRPVDTLLAPSETPSSLPPSGTQTPPAATLTLPAMPTPTAPTSSPTFTPASSVIPTTPAHTLTPNLPQAGLWHGGGDNLLLDFFIRIEAGKAFLIDIGILWEGRGECELNARYDVLIPVDENGFTMNYNTGDVAFELKGMPISSEVIQGVFTLNYRGCGDHQVNWRAVPKSGIGQRP